MVTKKHGVFIETPTEERQAEPGPSVLLLLVILAALAVSLLGVVWLLFFQT
jgi:hypothetical protein